MSGQNSLFLENLFNTKTTVALSIEVTRLRRTKSRAKERIKMELRSKQSSSKASRDPLNIKAALKWRNPRLYIGLYNISEALRQVFRVGPQEYFL